MARAAQTTRPTPTTGKSSATSAARFPSRNAARTPSTAPGMLIRFQRIANAHANLISTTEASVIRRAAQSSRQSQGASGCCASRASAASAARRPTEHRDDPTDAHAAEGEREDAQESGLPPIAYGPGANGGHRRADTDRRERQQEEDGAADSRPDGRGGPTDRCVAHVPVATGVSSRPPHSARARRHRFVSDAQVGRPAASVRTAVGCAVLFLLPFAAVGVGTAVAAVRAGAMRDWGQAGFLSIFALTFGGVGIGGIVTVLRGRRGAEAALAREARHPEAPWLWREDWAARRITDPPSSR